jgi:hypothetical protein
MHPAKLRITLCLTVVLLLCSPAALASTKVELGTVTVGAGYVSGPLYPYYPWGYYPPFGWWPYDGFYPPLAPLFYTTPQPTMGQVRIQTRDKDAGIYLNGAYAGVAQDLRSIWLEPGVYELSVRSANRANWEKRIYVLSGKTLKIRPEE